MPNVQTSYDPYSGQLSASQQSSALAGADRFGGEDDMGGLVGTIIGERRRKEQAARAEQLRQERMRQEQARDQEMAASRAQRQAQALSANAPFERARQASILETGFGRDRANLSTLIGGPQASHFQDYAARMAGMQAAGVPIYDYTGIKDIVNQPRRG